MDICMIYLNIQREILLEAGSLTWYLPNVCLEISAAVYQS